MALFIIYFKDGTKFEGGDILNTKWAEIPEGKEISSLEYYLPNGNKITLEGYEQYCHAVEVFHNIIGGRPGPEISNSYIVGANGDKADSYRITLKDGEGGERFRCGDITFRSGHKDKIYQGGKLWGWRGIKPKV